MYVSTLRCFVYLEIFEIGECVVLVSKLTAIVLTVTKQATHFLIKLNQSQNGYIKNRN